MKPLASLAVLLVASSLSLRAQGGDPKPPAAKVPSTLTQREIIDSLSEADLAKFLPLLRENYIGAGQLGSTEVSRATVQGLLDRLGSAVSLMQEPGSTNPPEPSPLRSELVEEHVGYLRLGSLSAANLSALDAALEDFTAHTVTALVLDLRATPAGSEFEAAAEIAKRFCPKGKVLFTLRKADAREERILTSRQDPRFHGLLAVLLDGDTAGAAEVLAAVLLTHAKAMLIGEKTQGKAAEFADLPLPSGKLLRVAVGEVALPENVSVFPGGVKPDLTVAVPKDLTDAVLKDELEKGVKALVEETDRPRMNEAALVAGSNPEIEAYQSAQRAKAEKLKPPLRDLVLQRALDFITTISIYERKNP